MRKSRKTDFPKLKITLVTMIYPGQRPQCPSLSPRVLLVKVKKQLLVNIQDGNSNSHFYSYT